MMEIKRTAPITTGKSYFSSAFTITTPIPFQSNTNSTKTAPARSEASHPEMAVTTGFNAFLRACFRMILDLLNPFALAVLM